MDLPFIAGLQSEIKGLIDAKEAAEHAAGYYSIMLIRIKFNQYGFGFNLREWLNFYKNNQVSINSYGDENFQIVVEINGKTIKDQEQFINTVNNFLKNANT